MYCTVNCNCRCLLDLRQCYYVLEPPGGVGLICDNAMGMAICGVPVLGLLSCPVLDTTCPVGNKPTIAPPVVGVVGVEIFGGAAKVPGVVGVTTLTGLIPGVVGVVGLATPGVSTPLTVPTLSVAGFFIVLIVCRICATLAQRTGPIAPKSFSYCSGESGGWRVRSNTPGQCF